MKMRKTTRLSAPITIGITLLLFAAALSAAARLFPGFAQWYSTTVYPALQGSLGRLSGLAPFSVGEMLCVLLPVILVIDAAAILINSKNKKRHASADGDGPSMHPIRRILRHVFVAACILIFLYSANCGVNYYRDPFVDPEVYANAQFTAADLDEFCEFTVSRIQDIYKGGPDEYPSGQELADTAVDSMRNFTASDNISEKNLPSGNGSEVIGNTSALSGFYPRPKQLTVMSGLFSKMGVSGIYCPFTIEANINGEMVDLEKPFTACHELSHLKGFMNEGEANYIGWLACISSSDKSFNRSGWLIAWIYAGNSLYRVDPDRYYELREKLPGEAVRELDANTEFWATHETRASEVQDRINDAYLKSNGQEQGIQTYSQLTTLMLAWFEHTAN